MRSINFYFKIYRRLVYFHFSWPKTVQNYRKKGIRHYAFGKHFPSLKKTIQHMYVKTSPQYFQNRPTSYAI